MNLERLEGKRSLSVNNSLYLKRLDCVWKDFIFKDWTVSRKTRLYLEELDFIWKEWTAYLEGIIS